MLLIPIGRDETIVRRTPMVSYAIIALNVAAYVLLNLVLGSAHFSVMEKKYGELIAYMQEHPYLIPPEAAAPYLPKGAAGYMAGARKDAEQNGSLPNRSVERAEQQRLDELAAELARLVDTMPERRFGFTPGKPSFIARFTSLFVHTDFMHLLGNMLFFFATGPFLEDVFGKPLFVALYLVSGVFATWCHASLHPDSMVTLLGASGAIAGVMGAYFLRFLRSKTQFLFMPILFMPRFSFRFFLPSYVVFPLWFLMQLWFAYNETEQDTVAFGAHVGGFVLGLLTASVVRYFKIEEKHIHPKIEAEISWSRNRNLDAADTLRASGDLTSARASVARCLSEEPENVDAMVMERELAFEGDDWRSWGNATSRLLDLYVKKKEMGLALELVHDTIGRGGTHVPERFVLRAADLVVRLPEERGWGLDLYRHVADRGTDPQNVLRALLRVARMERESGDAAKARDALERARSHPGCVGDWMSAVEMEAAQLAKTAGL
ncbi:MAG: rhomboid family intramembrane serine protease [Thermoanaerobaculia bacterium]|jgi:membrane associated rhomboid family serine protease